MIDGVSWAAGEIVGFMILASLVGLAIGWIFGRWLQRSTIAETYEKDLNAQSELARKAEHRLVESNAALDKAQEQLRAEAEKIGELEAQLGASQQTVSDLAVELSAAGGSDEAFAQMKRDYAAARAAAEQQAARVVELERQLVDSQREQGSADAAIQKTSELETRLAEAEQEKADLTRRLAAAEERIAASAHLPGELASLRDELARSNALAAELEGRVSQLPPAVLTKDDALSQIGEVAARTAGEAPVADDDLKKIHGIGPKLEGMLKDMGISSFRQIANFTTDDIAIVTAALDAFKGRIERDDWMSSAAEQHAEKYGEPL